MRLFKLIIVFLIMVFVELSAETWRVLGLEDHSVNCITIDHAHRILAGTDRGLFIRESDQQWLGIKPNDLSNVTPATDIAVINQARIITLLGGGFKTDGLYCGDAIWGPPYYALSPIDTMNEPQSLEFIRGEVSNATYIYVGNANSVKISMYDLSTDRFGKMTDIKIPPFAFGVEKPICADIYYYRYIGKLFAGGYDGMSMNPGNGNLLWMQSDSMTILVHRLNVTALSERFATDCLTVQMYIGTVDSGIYYLSQEMSHPPIKYASTPNNEKVNDLTAKPFPSQHILCVALKEGVYFYYRDMNSWEELGDIPARPKCLYVDMDSAGGFPGYSLYAGTENGVYLWDPTSALVTKETNYNLHNPIIFNKIGDGIVTIGLSINKPEKVRLTIYNVAGKIVFNTTHRCNVGNRTFNINLNNNIRGNLRSSVYLLSIDIGHKAFFRKLAYYR